MRGRNKADITIVGAGILGLLGALELVQRGVSVTIVDDAERRPASWAGGGILSPLYAWRYSEAMNQLAREAVPRYQTIVALLSAAGLPVDGLLYQSGMWVATRPVEQEMALQWAASQSWEARPCLAERVMSGSPAGDGVFFPHLGSIRNPRLLRQLRAYLRRSGVTFVNARVTALHPEDRGGRLILQDGQVLVAETVLLCAGAWNDRLLAELGPSPALFPAKGEMLLYQLPAGRVPSIMLTEEGYLIPRSDGAVLVGSTLRRGDASDYPSVNGRYRLESLASHLLPELALHKPAFHWSGVRPGCDRDHPWLGAIPGRKGWFAAAGCYRNGLVAAPACAALLAQLICEEPTELDSQLYAF